MSADRAAFTSCSPPGMLRMAAVSIRVAGHSEFTPMPVPRSSSARPRVVIDMPYFAMV